MPIFPYRCNAGHDFEHWIHPTASNKTPPEDLPCTTPGCAEKTQRIVASCMVHLKSDATQVAGWSKPGWSGIDYRNGPDGQPATHLRGLDGESAAYAD